MIWTKKIRVLGAIVSVVFVAVFSDNKEGSPAEATKYPERDIVIVVPWVAGGGSDVIARASAPYLRKNLPKPVNVIVQNITAAGGRVGSFQVYDAKPDGYTLGLLEPFVFVMADAMRELGNRKLTQMAWLARVSSQPYIMAVSPQSSIQSLADLKGKKVRAPVSHSTLAPNIAILQFLGAEPTAVLYEGGAASCLAAMRGDVDLVIQVGATVLRQSEASGGKLVPKVVFGGKRISTAPNLPSSKELGVDFPEKLAPFLSYDYFFAAPYGLREDVFRILTEAIDKTLRDPGFVETLEKAKLPVSLMSSQEVQKLMSDLINAVPQYIEAARRVLGQ